MHNLLLCIAAFTVQSLYFSAAGNTVSFRLSASLSVCETADAPEARAIPPQPAMAFESAGIRNGERGRGREGRAGEGGRGKKNGKKDGEKEKAERKSRGWSRRVGNL